MLPPGTFPPNILKYDASSVPILQLGLSGEGLSEQDLYDRGLNFIRTRLATVQGASVPLPYESKTRQIMVVHDGAIHLSLHDALALAIENGLDVEVGRYDLALAGTNVLRAQGGGTTRGIDFNIAESPTGVGGPGSPLLNSAASPLRPARQPLTN